MPNGNFLAMTANARMIENYVTSETDPDAPRATQPVVGDRFVEFTPDGEIVWSWDTFDHLDVNRWSYHLLEVYWHNRGFPHHLDWTHGNGITYDPNDDSVIVSLRHQDAIVKIDKASGEIRWILGDHGNWKSPQKEKLLEPAHDLRWHYHGHNPRVTVDGTIVMYDNGLCRAEPYDPQAAPHECFARAIEYEVDEAARTVREVWTSADDDDPERVISWAMGDAHRLANDNMLIVDSTCLPMREQLTRDCHVRDLTWNEWKREEWHPNDMPYWTRIREMKRDASREAVFELRLDDPNELVSYLRRRPGRLSLSAGRGDRVRIVAGPRPGGRPRWTPPVDALTRPGQDPIQRALFRTRSELGVSRLETHFSAERPGPQTAPRVSCPALDRGRPQDSVESPRKGSQASVGLSARPCSQR